MMTKMLGGLLVVALVGGGCGGELEDYDTQMLEQAVTGELPEGDIVGEGTDAPAVVEPFVCGDGLCEQDKNETLEVCVEDCGYCGDGLCYGDESWATCPEDCDSPFVCGDGLCESGEGCPEDCIHSLDGPTEEVHDDDEVELPPETIALYKYAMCVMRCTACRQQQSSCVVMGGCVVDCTEACDCD